jgi:hypothetical protein
MVISLEKMENTESITPRDYYKEQHPDQFSDSTKINEPVLTKEGFSFYLEQITSEGKEKDFEKFCRKIVEETICPNLLPQTGPTGGGDSKVDSETLPVSEEIAENWLWGYEDKAHSDRWAFAFSAKKDWRSKLNSDVKKIIETNTQQQRGYKRISFVTNQSVSDKKRAEAEDGLRTKYEIDIRILDRTWLVDSTFTKDNVNIAVYYFNMSQSYKVKTIVGSMDQRRRDRLANIEEELKKGTALKPSVRIKYLQESVELSRELEVDIETIKVVLERNIRQNNEYGTAESKAQAYYDYCWTMYWWYEDYEQYYNKYIELEKLYQLNRDNYNLLKDLSTLWINLNSLVLNEVLSMENLDAHTQLLEDEFQKFIDDPENPHRSLRARCDYQTIAVNHPEKRNDVLAEYSFILNNMGMNNDIDLDCIKRIMELPLLKVFPEYDDVFEMLVEKIAEMTSHISSAKLLLNRGDDYIEDNPYLALKYYSRAISQLFHEPVKTELIQTYLKFGWIFHRIGLLWASRTYFVRAFMESIQSYFDDGNPAPGLFLAARELKYIELELGRLEYALHFNEFEQLGRNIYPSEADLTEEELFRFDIWIAMALLKEDYHSLDRFDTLPDYLESNELIWASAMLKYKMGYFDDDFVKVFGGEAEFENRVDDIIHNPDYYLIPRLRNLTTSDMVLSTTVIGCEITISTPPIGILIEYASTMLSMIENMFATGIPDGLYPFVTSFNIQIELHDAPYGDIHFNYCDKTIAVTISGLEEIFSFEKRDYAAEKLFELLTYISVRLMNNTDNFDRLKKSIEEENVMFRTTGISSTIDSFLVEDGYNSLPAAARECKHYNILRMKDIPQPESDLHHEESVKSPKVCFDPEHTHFDSTLVKHTDVITSKVIDIKLWNDAGWKGVASLMDPLNRYAPLIAFLFEDKAGYKIFERWQEQGCADILSLGIIKGIDSENPLWYRVLVGEDMASNGHIRPNSSVIASMHRSCVMNANTAQGLRTIEMIKERYSLIDIIPMLTKDIDKFEPSVSREHCIHIKSGQIKIKSAVDLIETDVFLVMGLYPWDEILNPTGTRCYAEEAIQKLRLIRGAKENRNMNEVSNLD